MIRKIFAIFVLVTAFMYGAQTEKLEFNLKTVDNKTIKIKSSKNGLDMPQFKGKVVLVEFWGIHCPPCRYSIPKYIELKKKYKDKMVMIAVEVQATPKDYLKQFVKENSINYNILTQKENLLFVQYIAQRAGWRGSIPFLIIFDTDGDFYQRILGIREGEFEYLDALINKLTSQKPKTQETNTTKADKNTTK